VGNTTTTTINDAVNSTIPAAGINVDTVSNPSAAADSTAHRSDGGDSATSVTRRDFVDRGLHKVAKRLATMLSKMDTKAGDAKVVLTGKAKSFNPFSVRISVHANQGPGQGLPSCCTACGGVQRLEASGACAQHRLCWAWAPAETASANLC
jgi:hypothetical protein